MVVLLTFSRGFVVTVLLGNSIELIGFLRIFGVTLSLVCSTKVEVMFGSRSGVSFILVGTIAAREQV